MSARRYPRHRPSPAGPNHGPRTGWGVPLPGRDDLCRGGTFTLWNNEPFTAHLVQYSRIEFLAGTTYLSLLRRRQVRKDLEERYVILRREGLIVRQGARVTHQIHYVVSKLTAVGEGGMLRGIEDDHVGAEP